MTRIIDGDGHVVEPKTWDDYIEPAFRERAPRIVKDADGLERIQLDGEVLGLGGRRGPTTLGAGLTPGGFADPVKRQSLSYDQAHPGGTDPHIRIKDMDAEGIDVAVLYPSIGLLFGGIKDPQLTAACCRAYNNWLADYCKPYLNRLIGIAAVPLQDVDEAVQEMRRAVTKLGMHGVFVRPNPYNGRRLDDPAYDPFWTEAQELSCAIGVHEGTALNMPTVGAERYQDLFRLHMISHPLEQKLACMDFTAGGVLEKFPRLKVAFLESGGGWIGHWLDRLDSHYEQMGFAVPWLKMKPSEYFKRQCYISFDPDESTLRATVAVLGADNIIWASDYPHFDCTFPGVLAELHESLEGLPVETQQKILGGNAARLYGLTL
jgi:predicted TIM-barrel fold metal-dependent hydrolase